MRFLIILGCLLVQVGCAVHPGLETAEDEATLAALLDSVVIPQTDVLALNDEIKQTLDTTIQKRWSRNRKFSTLRDLLFKEDARNIQYEANTTGTAIETWNSSEGNCLAITNLFVASARYVGLPSEFQTVSVEPTWTGSGKTLIRYEHIIAVGRLGGRDKYIVDLLPGVTARETETQVINDLQAKALYYNNLGAEDVVTGNHASAVANILISIRLWPNHSDAWNNLGAAYRRSGDYRLAELSYKRALRLNRYNYSALANLTQIFLATGRTEQAEQFRERVDRYYAKNPYFHFYMAQIHFSGDEFDQAREALYDAIRLKGDDPQFFFALADTYAKLGEDERAVRMKEFAKGVKPRNLRYRGDRTRWSSVVTRGASSRL